MAYHRRRIRTCGCWISDIILLYVIHYTSTQDRSRKTFFFHSQTFCCTRKMRTLARTFLFGLVAAGVLIPMVIIVSWPVSDKVHDPRHLKLHPELDQLHVPYLQQAEQDSPQIPVGTYIEAPGDVGLPTKTSHPRSQQWRNHIREACLSLDMVGDPSTLSTDSLKQILVDDKNKMLYCAVPKVASTTWRRIFIQMSGKLDPNLDAFSINANDVHHKYDEYLTYLSSMPPDGIARRLKEYYKFMFVREPFERILSAFRNKFAAKTNSASYFKWSFGRRIIENYRTSEPIPVNNTGSGLKFEEFVRYLSDDGKFVKMNEHWEQYNRLCHPCHIKYDFVGKLEQIDEDSKVIMDSNSLSVKVPSRKESRYTLAKTTSFMKTFYSKVPRSSLVNLYEHYKADFIIFNYTLPSGIEQFM